MCQIDVIRNCKKVKEVKDALQTLPETLDETYERILSNIPAKYVEDVRRVLQCLICSFHPLDVEEVAEIVAIDTVEPYYDPENRYSSPRELLSVCSGLVSTRTSKRSTARNSKRRNIRLGNGFEIEELRLAHFSVKEYLVSERVNLGSASKYKLDEVSCHGTLADLCISYLLHFEEVIYNRQSVTETSDPEAQERWDNRSEPVTFGHFQDLHLCEENPFAPYAAMFWSTHLRATELDKKTSLYPKSLKLVAGAALLATIVYYQRDWFSDEARETIKDLGIGDLERIYVRDPRISPVYYASLLGLDYHVNQLLEEGESASSTGPSGTALAIAASRGHKSIVQLLINMGADVNGQTILREFAKETALLSYPALHFAIERKHEDIVHLLLDHGAAVNTNLLAGGSSADIMRPTPLHAALDTKNTSLVRNLLDRGADFTVEGAYSGNALQIACAETQDVTVARLLLEKGADPNASRVDKPNALTLAIERKNEPLQQLLIEYGADVALVDFVYVRKWSRFFSSEREDNEIEDYINQTKVRLAHFESLPKRSVVMSDSGEQQK